MGPLKIGAIGLGPHAVRAVEGLRQHPDVEVTVVCDLVEGLTTTAADRFGARATTDHRSVVADPDVDLVYVATPPRWHRDVTLDVIAAGKHILCEKPLALTVAEAEEMRDAARAAGVIHAVGHHSRYIARHRYMQRLVAEGFVGETRLVTVVTPANYGVDPRRTSYYAHPINERAEGGGMVFGFQSHYIDLLCFIFGDLTVDGTVSATSVPKRPEFTGTQAEASAGVPAAKLDSLPLVEVDGEDTIVVAGTLATGGLLSLASGWSLFHPGGDAWDIYGSEGTLRFRRGTEYSSPGELFGARRGDAQVGLLDLPDDLRTDDALHTLFADDLVRRFRDPDAAVSYATFDDALRTQRIIDLLTSNAPKRG